MARTKQTVRGRKKPPATAASLQHPLPTVQSTFTPGLSEKDRARLEALSKPKTYSSDSESDTDPGSPVKDTQSVVSRTEVERRALERINDENWH